MEQNADCGLFRTLMPWTKRDATEAAKLKEEGIKKVLKPRSEWAINCQTLIEKALGSMPKGHLFVGEDLRIACLEKGLEPPSHANAWGAVIGSVVRHGLKNRTIEVDGMSRTTLASSHRRQTVRYRKAV